MDRTLSALFDNRSDALAAADELVTTIGLSRKHIAVISDADPPDEDEAAGYGTDEEKRGFVGALADLFAPEEELEIYRDGIDRGGTTVVARVPESQIDRAAEIFESHAAVDLRQR